MLCPSLELILELRFDSSSERIDEASGPKMAVVVVVLLFDELPVVSPFEESLLEASVGTSPQPKMSWTIKIKQNKKKC